jgi:orotate phosphoribosyltransferase
LIQYTIAKMLLQIGAVTLRPKEPFTWTSGIKSPIYCDNRLTISYPYIRDTIANGFQKIITEQFGAVDVLAGTATAGIPHAAFVAQKMMLPMAYVREKAKGHGKENRIEGIISEGARVVVFEDTISTGGSSLKAVEAVREAGADVAGVVAIYHYEFDRAIRSFAEMRVPCFTLTNYSTLIDVAREEGFINEEELAVLREWKENPEGYAWK